MKILKVILLCLVFGNAGLMMGGAALATPLPPPKPYELTQAHADHLISMMGLRLGFTAPSSRSSSRVPAQSDWAKLMPWLRENAYKVPLWVTEMATDEIAVSVDNFIKCGTFAGDLPEERPADVISLSCRVLSFQLRGSPTVLTQNRLLFITRREADSITGRLWTTGSGFSNLYHVSLPAKRVVSR